MNIGKLNFKPIIDNIDLVPKCIYNYVLNFNDESQKNKFLVTEIDPNYADGEMLCSYYDIDKKYGYNCLIVECKRNETIKYCALLVPIGYQYNMGSVVRKYTNSRVVSVAPLEYVLNTTNMEYGSITPIGLPSDWEILVDSKIIENDYVIVGGGLKKSKILLPTSLLLSLDNVKVIEGLKKERCNVDDCK